MSAAIMATRLSKLIYHVGIPTATAVSRMSVLPEAGIC